MRVLILANSDKGLYNFRKELVERLIKEKHEIIISVPKGQRTDDLIKMGCIHIDTKLESRGTNPVKDLWLIRHYRKLLKEFKPDVVLTYTIKPNVYGGMVCSACRIPYIANVTGLGTTIENGGILSKISMGLYKIGLKNANCVFFQNSENQKKFIEKKVISGKSKLIPGSGVNLDMYCYETYPSEDTDIRFLFVGRIMRDKGIEELLAAINEIHQNHKNVILDIVGFCDENYEESLSEAEKSGAIKNHGIQSDVRPYYKMCHCTVLPSYHEGLANVMLESSASGRPVITTRVPGCKETFDEGTTGFGCEARDKNSLRDALDKFLSLSWADRMEMGVAARKKMEREFDRKIVIREYLSEINEISKNKME